MKQIPPLKAVMTPFPQCVEANQPVTAALELMEGHGIRHLPVTKSDRLVGVITEREVRLALGPAFPAKKKAVPSVGELVAGEAYVVELNEPLDVVVMHMAEQKIDCAVAVREGKPVGIFTMTDACRCLGGLLRSLFPRGPGEDAA